MFSSSRPERSGVERPFFDEPKSPIKGPSTPPRYARLRSGRRAKLLAAQTLFVVVGLCRRRRADRQSRGGAGRCRKRVIEDLLGDGVVRDDVGALDGKRAAVVKALHAALPGHHVDLVQVALMHVARQEDVERLALADVGRAVGRMLDQPALVDLEGGLEDGLLVIVEAVEVPDRALVGHDRRPGILVVAALLLENLLEVLVAHHEGARQRLVIVDVGRRRLDAGRGAAADDRDRCRRRDRDLVGEALSEAEVGGIRHAPRSLAKVLEAWSHWPRMCLNIFLFQTLAITASSGMPLACRNEWKPMMPRPTERSRMAE